MSQFKYFTSNLHDAVMGAPSYKILYKMICSPWLSSFLGKTTWSCSRFVKHYWIAVTVHCVPLLSYDNYYYVCWLQRLLFRITSIMQWVYCWKKACIWMKSISEYARCRYEAYYFFSYKNKKIVNSCFRLWGVYSLHSFYS